MAAIVASGAVSEAVLDRAAGAILRRKFATGLFEGAWHVRFSCALFLPFLCVSPFFSTYVHTCHNLVCNFCHYLEHYDSYSLAPLSSDGCTVAPLCPLRYAYRVSPLGSPHTPVLPQVNTTALPEVLDAPPHRALARTAAAEGIVLLQNTNGLLPLALGSKVGPTEPGHWGRGRKGGRMGCRRAAVAGR
jgi:beta-glucosidase-like glycosyl hydrolase